MVFHQNSTRQALAYFYVGALLLYAALEWALYPFVGRTVTAFGMVPLVFLSWSSGPWFGVAACWILFAHDLGFLLPAHGEDIAAVVKNAWPGGVAELLVGFVVGQLRSTSRRANFELNQRRQSDAELQRVRKELEDRLAEKQGDLAIRESESRLTNALNAAEMGMWDWNLATNRIVWSDSMRRLFDPAMESREITIEWVMACVLPEDRAILHKAIQSATEKAGEYQAEYRVRRTDGAVRWMFTRGRAMHDEANRGVSISGINVDITDRKHAEEKLRASEERFQLVTRATRDIVYDWDIATGYLWFNENAGFLLGYAQEEVRCCLSWWEERLHPGDHDRVCASLQEMLLSGQLWEQEYRLKRADGTYADVFERGYVIRNDEGAAIRMIGSIIDLTARKQAELALRHREEFFRALLENTMDNISVMTPDGISVYETPSSERLCGYTPEELHGKNCFDLLHPDDLERVIGRFRHDLETGEVGTPIRYRIRHRDGTWRINESVGQRFLDEHGRVLAIVNTRDATERDLLEQQLRQAQKMEAIGNLAGGVAHDFNNLLTVIMNYSHLAAMGLPEDSPTREDMQEIIRASERACGLTRQLLAFSRKQVLNPEVTSFNTILSDMTKMLGRLIGEDIQLTTALDGGLCSIRADVGQIEQVILNLAVNARDAMPTGGKLTIETRNVQLTPAQAAQLHLPDGNCAVLVVSDTGTGMDSETQHRIFEPFFTTKECGKGTGLGLSTVYGIVQQSGGLIEVESEVGQGTTFRIYMPRAEQQTTETPATAQEEAVAKPGTEMILLAEDEATLRRLARYVLEKNGYRVIEAESADAALQAAEQHSGTIDLLLTDVVMPGGSGRELAEQLQPRRPGLRVLYMSGYTDDAVVRHGVKHDRVALLQKPFTPEVLLDRVRAALKDPPQAPLRAA